MASVSCPTCRSLVRTPGLTQFRGFLTCPTCSNRFFATLADDGGMSTLGQSTTAAIPAAEIAAILAELPPEEGADATRDATDRVELDVAQRTSAALRLVGSSRVMPLEKFRFVIGRSGSDLAVDDPAISRQHAAIENHSEKFLLKDLGSTNGTYLNGRRVTVEFLADGDVIQAGKVKLRFEVKR